MRVVPREIVMIQSRPGMQLCIPRAGLFSSSECTLTILYERERTFMKMIDGAEKTARLAIQEGLSQELEGKDICLNGMIHVIRDMGDVVFVVLRRASGLVQCVYEKEQSTLDDKSWKEESAVEVKGTVRKEDRAPGGYEVRLKELRILSTAGKPHAPSNQQVEDEHLPGSQSWRSAPYPCGI